MIRIDGDTFYISAGETCYIFKIANGVPVHVYFGKRVEPEDDLPALGCDGTVPELTVAGGAFEFEAADVVEVDGERTLVVALADKKSKLEARMYYTPRVRGGISRSVVIKNNDKASASISVSQSVVCCGNNVLTELGGCFAVVGGGHENYGDAYGFLCADGSGNITASKGGEVTVSCESINAVTVAVGEECACPELLCVYSDVGMGGMSRIFHDILRESFDDSGLAESCSAVLFLPGSDSAGLPRAVKTAVGMGFGIVAVDGGHNTVEQIKDLSETCREEGISLGLRIRLEDIAKGSMLYSPSCKKNGAGYKYNCSENFTAAIVSAMRAVVADARYIMIEESESGDPDLSVRGMFALKGALDKEFDGLRVRYGIRSEKLRRALALCYPAVQVRNLISPSPAEDFKSRFDRATHGTLGYEFDPLEISDGIRLAVRAQILSYQDDALTVIHGDIYRQENSDGSCRMAVSKDKSRAYAVCNSTGGMTVKLFGLDEHNLYHVHEQGKTFSGAALVHCGIRVGGGTYVLHIRQVADY